VSRSPGTSAASQSSPEAGWCTSRNRTSPLLLFQGAQGWQVGRMRHAGGSRAGPAVRNRPPRRRQPTRGRGVRMGQEQRVPQEPAASEWSTRTGAVDGLGIAEPARPATRRAGGCSCPRPRVPAPSTPPGTCRTARGTRRRLVSAVAALSEGPAVLRGEEVAGARRRRTGIRPPPPGTLIPFGGDPPDRPAPRRPRRRSAWMPSRPPRNRGRLPPEGSACLCQFRVWSE
jgi:hypothetical protein